MAKSKERHEAIKLRKQGESIKDISIKLKISKSTISLWCKEIRLTPEQIDALHKKMVFGGYHGRMKGAAMNREMRQKKVKVFINDGKKEIGGLSKRDWLMLGLGLYLGEGGKKRQFQFTNSNADLIRLAMNWLSYTLNVKKENFVIRMFINEIHKDREDEIRKYWTKELNLPVQQFKNSVFIKSKNKKIYENRGTYFGVINLGVRRSTDLQSKIFGLNYGILGKWLLPG